MSRLRSRHATVFLALVTAAAGALLLIRQTTPATAQVPPAVAIMVCDVRPEASVHVVGMSVTPNSFLPNSGLCAEAYAQYISTGGYNLVGIGSSPSGVVYTFVKK
jgi:hypothetical protein